MAGKFPLIDRIWRSRGHVIIEGPVSTDEAIDRLSELFDPTELKIDRDEARIEYRKPNPAAQDKLATFSNGALKLADRDGRKMLHFDVGSPALLLTFLAPLLFLALGQGITGLGQWEEAKAQQQSEKADEKGKDEPRKLHWIDQMLGAPAPENPNDEEEEDEENEDYDPKGAYGLAALFALIYLVGRILEPRLLKKTLRRVLSGSRVSQN